MSMFLVVDSILQTRNNVSFFHEPRGRRPSARAFRLSTNRKLTTCVHMSCRQLQNLELSYNISPHDAVTSFLNLSLRLQMGS